MFCIKHTGIACLHLEPQSLDRLHSHRVAIWILEAIKHMLQSMLLFAYLHPDRFCLSDQLLSWTSHTPIVVINQDLQCLGSFLEWWNGFQEVLLQLIWDTLEVFNLVLLMEDVSLHMGWVGVWFKKVLPWWRVLSLLCLKNCNGSRTYLKDIPGDYSRHTHTYININMYIYDYVYIYDMISY